VAKVNDIELLIIHYINAFYTMFKSIAYPILSFISFLPCFSNSISFYAFDIPVPDTMCYHVQHCTRSIYSLAAAIPRHRFTTEDPRTPWEFRMDLYVVPAALEDCSFTQTPSVSAEDAIYDDDEEDEY
jgi:hypothetical protein